MDTSSIFSIPPRTWWLRVDSIGKTGCMNGCARAIDNNNRLYDIQISNVLMLALADAQPNSYSIKVIAVELAGAMIHPNSKGVYPKVGECDVEHIEGVLIAHGVSLSPKLVGMTTISSNRHAGSNVPLLYNTTPTLTRSSDLYDTSDEAALNNMGGGVGGISMSEKGGMSMGSDAKNMVNFSATSGMSMNADNQTVSTQNTHYGGGILSDAPASIWKYFIGLGRAVSAPPKDLPNLVKMVAIGVFVKTAIGKKGSRITTGPDAGKWKDGTGIYGLTDQIADFIR